MIGRRKPGGLEEAVLATLWSVQRPLTAGEIVQELGGELAHTTVQTILVRLSDKGAVIREKAGRAHTYTPMLDGAGLVASRMQAQLDRGGDHTAVLASFLRTLTPEDEAIVADLLQQQRLNSAG